MLGRKRSSCRSASAVEHLTAFRDLLREETEFVSASSTLSSRVARVILPKHALVWLLDVDNGRLHGLGLTPDASCKHDLH